MTTSPHFVNSLFSKHPSGDAFYSSSTTTTGVYELPSCAKASGKSTYAPHSPVNFGTSPGGGGGGGGTTTGGLMNTSPVHHPQHQSPTAGGFASSFSPSNMNYDHPVSNCGSTAGGAGCYPTGHLGALQSSGNPTVAAYYWQNSGGLGGGGDAVTEQSHAGVGFGAMTAQDAMNNNYAMDMSSQNPHHHNYPWLGMPGKRLFLIITSLRVTVVKHFKRKF